jgi:3-methylfumaryl-CoA hydratase
MMAMTDTTIDAALLARLQSWEGRSETAPGTMTAAPVRALSARLDREDAAPVPGTELPPLRHWLYFLPHASYSHVGLNTPRTMATSTEGLQ